MSPNNTSLLHGKPIWRERWDAALFLAVAAIGVLVIDIESRWRPDSEGWAIPIAMLSLLAGASGAACPRHPWRWSVAVALGQVLALVISCALHPDPEVGLVWLFGPLYVIVVLAAALGAAYVGAFLRIVLRDR